VAEVRERLAASKQRSHSLHLKRLSLKKLNEAHRKRQYHIQISCRNVTLENLDVEVDSNCASETL
jgi:hypothetical protein